MIRETKVGLVVTCSFLGLLGVVVTSKLNGKKANDDHSAHVEHGHDEEVASATPVRKDKEEKREESPKAKPPKRLPAGVEQTKFEEPAPPPSVAKEDKPAPEATAPPPPMTESPAPPPPEPMTEKTEKTEKTEPKVEAPAPALPVVEKSTEPAPPEGPPSAPPAAPMTAPLPPPVAETTPRIEPMKEPVAIPLPAPEPEVKEGVPEPKIKLISSPPAPPDAAKEKAPPLPEPAATVPMVEVPIPVPPAAPESAKDKADNKDVKKDDSSPPGPPTAVAGPAPAPVPETPMPVPMAAPPMVPSAEPPMTIPPTPEKPIALPSPEAVKVGVPGETTPPPVAPSGPMPTTPPMIVPTPAAPMNPPAPAVVARTEPMATTTSEPPVVRFVEEDYKTKAGETYASISKNRYGSEEYAEALAQYNRNDALPGPPVLEKDGSVRAGQVVSVPDLNFLEKRYGKYVPHMKAPEKGTEPPTAGKTAATPPPVAKGPTYQVPGKGQTMREIARLTLGNGERWKDIYHLNAQYRPDYAVPGGTVLTLPPDAKVPGAVSP